MKRLFELIFQLHGTQVNKFSEEVNNRVSIDTGRAKSIFEYHLVNNPRYKKFNSEEKFLKWEEVPVIGKNQFQEGFYQWVSSPYQEKKLFVNSTSGSSGIPLKFAKDWECHARTWALIQKRYGQHRIDVFQDLEARFYGIPLSNKLSYFKEKAKDWIANRVRFPVFDLSDPILEKYYLRFQSKNFVYLNGYTSSLVAFANFILRKQYAPLKNICPTLKACITTSEMCSDADRRIMEHAFGIKVINEYGAAELGIIAIEDPDGDWVINEENLYVEVVDDENQPIPDGQEGKILVTALYNKAMPFIRYELGDRGIISPGTKNGFRKLEKLTGRTNDMAILPSGRVVPGLTFYYVTKSLLQQEGLIREIVVRQNGADQFEVIYTADRDLNNSEKNKVKKLLDTYMEPDLHLTLTRVDHVQRQNSGKFKQFEKTF